MKVDIKFEADLVQVSSGYDRGKVSVTIGCDLINMVEKLSIRDILSVMDQDEFLECIGQDRAAIYWAYGK
jgi:hypothetical protein